MFSAAVLPRSKIQAGIPSYPVKLGYYDDVTHTHTHTHNLLPSLALLTICKLSELVRTYVEETSCHSRTDGRTDGRVYVLTVFTYVQTGKNEEKIKIKIPQSSFVRAFTNTVREKETVALVGSGLTEIF